MLPIAFPEIWKRLAPWRMVSPHMPCNTFKPTQASSSYSLQAGRCPTVDWTGTIWVPNVTIGKAGLALGPTVPASALNHPLAPHHLHHPDATLPPTSRQPVHIRLWDNPPFTSHRRAGARCTLTSSDQVTVRPEYDQDTLGLREMRRGTCDVHVTLCVARTVHGVVAAIRTRVISLILGLQATYNKKIHYISVQKFLLHFTYDRPARLLLAVFL